MKIFRNIFFTLLMVIFTQANATIMIKISTPEADIYIARPVDLWSGDIDHQEKSLLAIKERKVSYMLFTSDGKLRLRGSPLLFQGIADHPVTKMVEKNLSEAGTNLINGSGYYFSIYPPLTIAPEQFVKFSQYQNHMFEKFVIAQGDPKELQNKVGNKKFIAGVLSVASTVYVADKLGNVLGSSVATQSVLNSSLPGDVYEFGVKSKAAVAPVLLDNIDTSGYRRIDVRRVQAYTEMIGQVIIAYKSEFSEDMENSLMTKAIYSLAGADTTVDEVEQARLADFNSRIQIWEKSCSTTDDGKCGRK